jgi:hypothetical protein
MNRQAPTAERRERRTTVLVMLVTLVPVTAVAAVLFVSLLPASGIDCGEFRFERSAWDSGGETGRRDVASGLAKCQSLVGKTRGQLRRLLGPWDTEDPRFVYYDLGPGPGENLQYLNVHFGAANRAQAAWVE